MASNVVFHKESHGEVLEHRYSSRGLLSMEGAHGAFLLPPGVMRAMPLIFILTLFWLALPMCIILSLVNKRKFFQVPVFLKEDGQALRCTIN